MAWIEGTNVDSGNDLAGSRDSRTILSLNVSRIGLLVNREELFDYTWAKLKEKGFPKGKKAYHIYDRAYWGKRDKLTLVPYDDIEKLNDITKLEK